jgi:hypothetical protein
MMRGDEVDGVLEPKDGKSFPFSLLARETLVNGSLRAWCRLKNITGSSCTSKISR